MLKLRALKYLNIGITISGILAGSLRSFFSSYYRVVLVLPVFSNAKRMTIRYNS